MGLHHLLGRMVIVYGQSCVIIVDVRITILVLLSWCKVKYLIVFFPSYFLKLYYIYLIFFLWGGLID